MLRALVRITALSMRRKGTSPSYVLLHISSRSIFLAHLFDLSGINSVTQLREVFLYSADFFFFSRTFYDQNLALGSTEVIKYNL